MPINPYESPASDEAGRPANAEPAAALVAGPAWGLIVTACLSIVVLVLEFGLNVYLIGSGRAQGIDPDTGMKHEKMLKVRLVIDVLTLLMNGAVLNGALQMRRLQNQRLAESVCLLALIPCCSPCLVLGIPFGIWGLFVLRNRQVQQAFRS